MSSPLLTVHFFDYVSFDDRRTKERLLVFSYFIASVIFCTTPATFNFHVFLCSSAFELPLMYGVQFASC